MGLRSSSSAATAAHARIVERSRIELTEAGRIWTKAPYHAAEDRKPAVAKRIVERGMRAAHRVARVEIERLAERLRQATP